MRARFLSRRAVRWAAAMPLVLATPALTAQGPTVAVSPAPPATLSRADSVLVLGILAAEEFRQGAAPALQEGRRHTHPWMRWLSARAAARIADDAFAARDSLGQPSGSPLPSWPAPEWQARLDALTPRAGCETLAAALSDAAPLVQLRAASVAAARGDCSTHSALHRGLRDAVDALPDSVTRRRPQQASWQLAAQSIIALARLDADAARALLPRLARHPQAQVRRDAARAAAVLGDATVLRALADDGDANVLEAVLEGLHGMDARARDSIAERLLGHPAPQVIRAAAAALQGPLSASAQREAETALTRLEQRRLSYERDARVALRQMLGMPAVDAIALPLREALPVEAVGLARGERRYLEVTMDPAFGGGRFVVELRGDVAPIMAARVLQRARAGDYNGTTWHRVVPNFIVQGLSPAANEYVGYAPFLVDELSTMPHPRGSVGMSTRGHDTGDGQWFINTRDNPRLTADYTVFAAVVEGMDVVDRLLEGDRVVAVREISGPRR